MFPFHVDFEIEIPSEAHPTNRALKFLLFEMGNLLMRFEVRNLLKSLLAIFALKWSIPNSCVSSHMIQKLAKRIMEVIATLMSTLENLLNPHTRSLALQRS